MGLTDAGLGISWTQTELTFRDWYDSEYRIGHEVVGTFDGMKMYGKGTLVVEGSYDPNDKILEAKFRIKGVPQLGDAGEGINVVVVGALKTTVAGEVGLVDIKLVLVAYLNEDPGSALQTQHTIHARWGHSGDSLNGRLHFSQTRVVPLTSGVFGQSVSDGSTLQTSGVALAIRDTRCPLSCSVTAWDARSRWTLFYQDQAIRRAVALFK